MSALGPELPPHLLAKRKRRQEEGAEARPANTPGANRIESPENGEKRRKVIGPAMPAAPSEERPTEPAQPVEDSDSDEDNIGPAPPGTDGDANDRAATPDDKRLVPPIPAPKQDTLRRDEWMLMPPKQDDLAARLDPSKPRARGFNTGKGAKGPADARDTGNAWHETAEEKQKRLQNEMMGITSGSTGGPKPSDGSKTDRRTEEAKKLKQQATIDRGPSLMDQHKESRPQDEVDDDPSKRAFDREKDMGSGMRISGAQKKEMLSKASNFSSRFAGGSYL